MRSNSLSSNAWHVWVDKHGNEYITSRDDSQGLKISLHKSGKQHIAFTSESNIKRQRVIVSGISGGSQTITVALK